MVKDCLKRNKYQMKLNCGEELSNEPYSIVVVFLRTVNLMGVWQLGTESFTKLKAGLTISTNSTNWSVVLQIWRLIQLLSLKKEQKNILKIHQEKGQHYYQLYLIDYSVGIMVKKIIKQIHYLTMNCSRCLKEHKKLWWFNSDCNMWDNALYCKQCYSHIFKKLPEEVKLTFAGYKGEKK